MRVAVTHAGESPVPPLWAVTVPPRGCTLVDSGWPASRTQVVRASGLGARPRGAAGKQGGLVALSHSTTSLLGARGTRGSPGARSIGWCGDLSACGAFPLLLPPRSSRMPKYPRSSLCPLLLPERPPALCSATCTGKVTQGDCTHAPTLAELEAWGSGPPPPGGPLTGRVGAAGETFPSSTLGAPSACFWGQVPAGPNQRQAAQALGP